MDEGYRRLAPWDEEDEQAEADREWSLSKPPFGDMPAVKADAVERELRIKRRINEVLVRHLPIHAVEPVALAIWEGLRRQV